MENRAPQLIIMISGCVALIAGIAMVAVQFLHELNAGHGMAGGGIGFTVFTVGAVLEAVGYVATMPWRTGKAEDLPINLRRSS